MSKWLRVSIEAFAHEIASDLPNLIKTYPSGIYFSVLADDWGESAARIMKACRLLEERRVLTVHQAASNAYYVLPAGYTSPVPFMELTELQRRLVMHLLEIGRKNSVRVIRTNYSQLARLIGCSYGGCITCVNRLVSLEYLVIDQASVPGKQDQLLLRLTDTLLAKADTQLPS